MQILDFIPLMKENARRIESLVNGLSLDEARWKPTPNDWSVLEVINHLYDEEKEDFRVRLDIVLQHPDKKWPPIDPQGWVKARNYNARDFQTSLQHFLEEREVSLSWLHTLDQAIWETEYEAPFGLIRAGDMLAAWVTHDHHHMRQLVGLLRGLILEKMAPFEGDYAGQW
jgi:hypothetical protein